MVGKTMISGAAVTTPSASINLVAKSPIKPLVNYDVRLKPTIPHIPLKDVVTIPRMNGTNGKYERIR